MILLLYIQIVLKKITTNTLLNICASKWKDFKDTKNTKRSTTVHVQSKGSKATLSRSSTLGKKIQELEDRQERVDLQIDLPCFPNWQCTKLPLATRELI